MAIFTSSLRTKMHASGHSEPYAKSPFWYLNHYLIDLCVWHTNLRLPAGVPTFGCRARTHIRSPCAGCDQWCPRMVVTRARRTRPEIMQIVYARVLVFLLHPPSPLWSALVGLPCTANTMPLRTAFRHDPMLMYIYARTFGETGGVRPTHARAHTWHTTPFMIARTNATRMRRPTFWSLYAGQYIYYVRSCVRA